MFKYIHTYDIYFVILIKLFADVSYKHSLSNVKSDLKELHLMSLMLQLF